MFLGRSDVNGTPRSCLAAVAAVTALTIAMHGVWTALA